MIGNKVKGIGEVVLRVKNMELMKDFYLNTIGLELLDDRTEGFTFFKIAEGYGGHTQVLVLFSETNPDAFENKLDQIENRATSLHHFALEIDRVDYNEVLEKIKTANITYRERYFAWVNWKSIFIKDTEENTIEFVCYDTMNENRL